VADTSGDDRLGAEDRPIYPVSLILCTRNRQDMLRSTLHSILAGDSLPAELIVMDQSDTPDSLGSTNASGTEVRYIWTREAGLCRASNTAVENARHDIVAFTHDDVFVEKSWFRNLVEPLLRDGPGTVVTGRVVPTEPEIPGGFAPTLSRETEPRVYEGRIGHDVLKPLNMAMYKSALQVAGGFDTRLGPGTEFPGAEDSDLGFRLLETGHRVVFVPNAVVSHRAWRPAGDYLPLRWNYGVAQGAFFAKHLPRAGMLGRMLRDWYRRARRFPRRMVREGSRGLGDPLFIAGNVVGLVRWLVRNRGLRLRSSDGRRARPAGGTDE
jgi:O-antigen biosynthesis protein